MKQLCKKWAKKNKVSVQEPLSDSRPIYSQVWKFVQNCNQEFANYEQVKKIAICPEDFTIENGLLTPTFKIKRNLVLKHYSDLIETLYRS